ncbi:Lysine-specific demethylase 6A [Cichlidogyrus casuarinus]|uniref:Lysine-specific demethylase 6A n=1 Tax=Cichlidogyrus casuarinus TaxID=1844966 RepID=A0ABD2QAR8_9PLAT
MIGSKRPRSQSLQSAPGLEQKEVAPLTTQERQTLNALNKTADMPVLTRSSLKCSHASPTQLRGSSLTPQQRQVLYQLQSQALKYHVQNLKRNSAKFGRTTFVGGVDKQQTNDKASKKKTSEDDSRETDETDMKPAVQLEAKDTLKTEVPDALFLEDNASKTSGDNLLNVADCFNAQNSGVPADVGSPPDNLPEDFDDLFWADDVLAQMSDQLVDMFPPNFEKDTLGASAVKRQAFNADGTPMPMDVEEKPTITDLHAFLTKPLAYPMPNVLASLNISMTGKQVLDMVRGIGAAGQTWSPSVLPEGSPWPAPPVDPYPPAPVESLQPPTPTVYLENRRDAFSHELMQFCMSQPVVVIRGMASTLRMDLSLFSTKTLAEAHPEHPVEVRLQKHYSPDDNTDHLGNQVWTFGSSRTFTTIAKYAAYQASTFVEALKEEKFNNSNKEDKMSRVSLNNKTRMIKFGTNCDLSEESKWFLQLNELNKLPTFLKVCSAPNMLSHVGYNLLGMNSVQLYMKVPGSRTPGHQENNNLCSININIGPGDCEWFNVPEQYWGTIHRLCEKHNIDYLSGSWWPVLQDLIDSHVPLYRFIQKPGDLVWISSGTVHWVQAIGWCNNIAWNVGPMCARTYELAINRYEYNRLRNFKSIVPMVHLSWQLAKNIKVTDKHLFELIKQTLNKSLALSQLSRDFVEKSLGRKIHYHGKGADDVAHMCNDCEVEVFNILYVMQQDRKYYVRCLDCIRKVNASLSGVRVLCEYQQHELVEIYDSFQLQTGPMSAYPVGK